MLADVAHLVRRRDRDVEVGEPLLDALREVGRADDVRSGLLRLAGLVALGEDGDADALAGAVREHERAAELLVGVAHVEAEPEVRLHGLVEVGGRQLLQRPDRLGRRVELLAVDLAAGLRIALAVRAHRSTSTLPRTIAGQSPAIVEVTIKAGFTVPPRHPSLARCRR
jgi:hypothetical protein